MSDSESVWVATTSVAGKRNHYHSDPDCPRLKYVDPDNLAEKELVAIESHRDHCKECAGEVERYRADGDTKATMRALLETDVDEVLP